MKPQLTQLSPQLFELKWIRTPDDSLLQVLLNYEKKIKEDFPNNQLEARLGYNSILIQSYAQLHFEVLSNWINQIPDHYKLSPLPERIWRVPVCYSPSTGRDLKTLCSSKGMSMDELIHLHTTPKYRIHFYGFLPGFMYLNGLSDRLATPRKQTPDRQVPAGSLAIGGAQTGIYPSESPGGWHLIGRSPTQFFDINSNPPVFASVGERIAFYPISEAELERINRHPLTYE